MGRDLKRVAVGFNWPTEKIWKGYLNPFRKYGKKCKTCGGSGMSPEGKRLQDLWYGYLPFKPEDNGSKPFLPDNERILAMAKRNCGQNPTYYGGGDVAIEREAWRLCQHFNNSWSHHLNADDIAALLKSGRLMDFTHTWSKETRWQLKDPPYIPTPEEVNQWSISGFGHDSINCWSVTRAKCEKYGWPRLCTKCKGEGNLWKTRRLMQKYEKWVGIEPPAGDWWQVWETVSEGSPVTPAFPTANDLVDHLVKHGDAWDQHRGNGGWKRENAEAFVKLSFAPSLIVETTATGVNIIQPRDTRSIAA